MPVYPYGYNREGHEGNKDKVNVNHKEVIRVSLIFKCFLEGHAVSRIVTITNSSSTDEAPRWGKI
jgi:hypothetical protein